MADLFALLLGVILVLSVAAVVRVLAARTSEVVYPVLLVVVGVAATVLGVAPEFRLSADVILMVLVPTVLFQGSQETKSESFLRVLPVAVLLPILGLPIAVALLGTLGSYAFGLPLVVTLLFAVIIYPVDPVAIVALFREADAAERLAVLAEVESHFSDGFAVVTYGVMIGVVSDRFESGTDLATLLGPADLLDIAVEITVVSFGGVLVGLVAGVLALVVLRAIEDRMAELLTTVVLAYGSFLLADHYLHVSGVLATVAAGLVIGLYGKGGAVHPDNVSFIERTWDTAAFLVFTLVFVLVGVQAPWRRLLGNAPTVLLAAALVLVVRAVVVYGVTNLVTVTGAEPVPYRFQHVLVWGGMHTVIPIALLLSVPRELPFRSALVELVFGVALVGIVAQGLLFPVALRVTGAAEEPDEESPGMFW
ncbi:cation:proton antiporter [Halosimplex salinum]|uniref:cation:proton antiporter n=1 Tax=Halosimplex salinum TaxID=1710538 RepID=UPI000F4AF3B7|nr:cation:proton antiporter [Halosimplex salinum]